MAGRPQPKNKSNRSNFLVWLILPPLMIFAMPSVALLAVALLPTFVAGLVDRREGKYAAYCVGGFNLSGTVPWLFKMWVSGGDGVAKVTGILTNPFALLSIFGGAAIGWLVYFSVPLAVMRWQGMRDAQKVRSLRNRQAVLIEEWGQDLVEGAPPAELFAAQG